MASSSFDTNDAQYDLSWSEINENQLVAACGDGSIKLFDLNMPDFPVMNFHEHKRECFSVQWNPTAKDTFASSSWDGTVKIWSPTRQACLRTLPIGTCTYSISFSPHNPSILSAVAADSHIRVFDLRTPSSAQYHMTAKIPVHMGPGAVPVATSPPTELLTHDWNKYREGVVAAAGVDRVIRIFDIRNPAGGPLAGLHGHEYAVRRLAWSPHAGDILISAGYDMTCRVWTDGSTVAPDLSKPAQIGIELGQMNRHTEFVTGVDWCLFGAGGWVASVGWDERMLLWDAHMLLGARG